MFVISLLGYAFEPDKNELSRRKNRKFQIWSNFNPIEVKMLFIQQNLIVRGFQILESQTDESKKKFGVKIIFLKIQPFCNIRESPVCRSCSFSFRLMKPIVLVRPYVGRGTSLQLRTM